MSWSAGGEAPSAGAAATAAAARGDTTAAWACAFLVYFHFSALFVYLRFGFTAPTSPALQQRFSPLQVLNNQCILKYCSISRWG